METTTHSEDNMNIPQTEEEWDIYEKMKQNSTKSYNGIIISTNYS